MTRAARILPLAAVAVGGVLAFKALDAVGGVGSLFPSATARAEEAAPRTKAAHAPAPSSTQGGPATPGVAVQPAKPPATVCAPGAAELAREAGLSPAELNVIQSLSARRGQLDAREQALDAQLQLLAAAETKVDAKLRALDAGKAQLQALLGQADAQGQAEVDRLVVVYEKMKPADAGAIMAQLDDKVRVPVAAKMKPAILAAVLPKMGGPEAKHLTETLARRFASVREQVAAASAPPATAPAPAGAKAAPPVQTADGSAAGAASPPAAPATKPRRVARAAPPSKPHAAKPSPAKADPVAKPAETASAKPAEPARPGAKPAA